MSHPEARAKWQSVMDVLRQQVSPAAFRMWFETLQLHEVTDAHLVLYAENALALAALNTRFRTLIQRAAATEFIQPITLAARPEAAASYKGN